MPLCQSKVKERRVKKYISLDIGGTYMKYGLIDENGNILEKNELATEAEKGGPQILDKAMKIIGDYTAEHDIEGVAISTAGMVDTEKGAISYASELIPNYTGVNFKNTIREKFDLPCVVENDVNCAGLAEYKTGAGKGSEIAIVLTIGTGIGGSAIINGEVYHGASGSAMEVGYMHVNGSTFETLGSAKALVEKVAKLKEDDVANWDGKKIFDLAKEGDEICIRAIDEMCDILAIGISNIAYVLNPDMVILGGGIMAQGEYLYDKIDDKLKIHLEKPLYDKISLKFASHQNSAGMLGAYYNYLNQQ